jgi:hypothetical protein
MSTAKITRQIPYQNLIPNHHLLLSAGRDIYGQNRFSLYIGFQWTFGPREKKKESLSRKDARLVQ